MVSAEARLDAPSGMLWRAHQKELQMPSTLATALNSVFVNTSSKLVLSGAIREESDSDCHSILCVTVTQAC